MTPTQMTPTSKRRSFVDKSDDGNGNFIERSAGRFRSA